MTDLAELQAIVDSAPYHRWLGIRVTGLNPERSEVTTEITHRPEFDRADAAIQFHGGIISAFIDTTGDIAMALVAGGAVPTINLRIDFLRPATGRTLTGQATIRRSGRTLGIVDVDVTDAGGKLIAIGRGTYSAVAG